ncbi:MAG TPA: hypothetical protein EYP49_11355 [Anaerolineae bacterium]|nr:hypothetical protein [Anaerolineae bacterium]
MRASNRDPLRLVLLLILGSLSELVYVYFFLRPYPLLKYYATPLLDLGKIADRSRLSAAAFATAFLLLFALYYAGYRLCLAQDSAHWPWVVLTLATVFCLTLMFVYPIGAADIFDYIINGRILAHYRLSPFVHVAGEFPRDPITPYAAWRSVPSAYGPLWAFLAAGINFLAGSADLLANMWAFKGLAILFYVLDIGLIYGILGEIKPAYALPGAFLFAWNPLLLFETAANGHNDSVMMFFVLLAIYLLLKRGASLSIIAITCSVMIKFITIILLPFFLLSLLRPGEKKAPQSGDSEVGGRPRLFQQATWLSSVGLRLFGDRKRQVISLIAHSLLSIGVMAILYAPFWKGFGTIRLGQRLSMFTDSLPTLVMLLLRLWLDVRQAKWLVGRLALAALGLFCLTRLFRLVGHEQLELDSEAHRTRRVACREHSRMTSHPHLLITASFEMILFYLLFTCTWLQPWYLVWLVALAALVPDLDTAHQTILFSYTMTWAYVVYHFVWFWYIPAMNWMNRLGVHSVAAGATLVAPWVFSTYLLWKRRNRKGQ